MDSQALQNEKDGAARALYDAEVQLHAARQSKVDGWIAAAAARLHEAISRYDAIVLAPLAL
jgi:hypothetical protein